MKKILTVGFFSLFLLQVEGMHRTYGTTSTTRDKHFQVFSGRVDSPFLSKLTETLKNDPSKVVVVSDRAELSETETGKVIAWYFNGMKADDIDESLLGRFICFTESEIYQELGTSSLGNVKDILEIQAQLIEEYKRTLVQ